MKTNMSIWVFLFLFSSCQSRYPIRSCFSPEGKCDEELIASIRASKTQLDIAVFDLTHPQIVHEILLASKRGKVRVLVDKRQSQGTHSLVSSLIRAGLEVRSGRQRGIMHHKFMIVDGQELQTGSFNFTVGASFKNQENQVYVKDPEVVKKFQAQFEKMWSESKVLSNP